MANLTESDSWEAGIYQLEEDDPVLGGPTGIDNLAPRQLASRSLYQRLRNVTPWVATLAYPASLAFVSHAGTTWKSVDASTAVEPGTDDTKWTRWAHTKGELNELLSDSAVRFDEAQPLTDPQKLQGRTNIGAEAAGVAATEVQKGAARYSTATGTANAVAVTYAPAIAALTDGMVLLFKATAANTGATSLNVNGIGAKAVVGGAHAPLQGGELAANGTCMVTWKEDLDAFVLIECTGAALQVGTATKSAHAATLAQLAMGTHVKGLTGNTVGPGLTTVTLSAAEVLMRNPTTGASLLALNVGPVDCNISTAGPAANARDQAGAFATGAWVHFWFISDGATMATIASPSATAPILPPGYTSYAYAGTMLMGAGTLTPMRFRGNKAFYDSGIQTVAGAGNTTETLNLLTASVPPNAPTMLLMANVGLSTNASGAAGSNLGIRHTTGSNFLNMTNSVAVANQTAWNSSEFELPNISQKLYFLFYNETSPTSISARQAYINVLGFTMPNGG